ncbi:hypothetical protein M569_14957, partial [Genlisea aurea]
MSSGANTHWCYQCSHTIRPEPRTLTCPYCNGGFIQELPPELVGPYFDLAPGSGFLEQYRDPRMGLVDAFSALMRQRISGRDPNFDIRTRTTGVIAERGYGPSRVLIFHGQPPMSVHAHPVADPFEAFFAPAHGSGISQRPSDFGDFFLGHHGLQQLIEQLSINDRRGPPPAPRSAIDAMPTIRITQKHIGTDAHCPVCQDKFELGSKARQMPCDHIYHSDCIVPWLVEHNSCPVCRVELPPQGSSRPRNWNRGGGGGESGTASSRRSNNDDGGSNNSNQNGSRWNPFSYLWP